MSKTGSRIPGKILELFANETMTGHGARGEELLDALPAGISAEDRARLLEVAGLAQISFLRAEANAAEEMPERVRSKVMEQADAFIAARGMHANARTNIHAIPPRITRTDTRGRKFDLNSLGWLIAAALAVAFVVVGNQSPTTGDIAAAAKVSAAAQRIELLKSAADVIQVEWSRPADPDYGAVIGDVVWSQSEQRGFLRLAGMPVNDPSAAQYQLWIVDPERDIHPIDGGVFNVSGAGREIVIPIIAKIPVISAQAFAITLEKSGGVVVSDGPLLVVAATENNIPT